MTVWLSVELVLATALMVIGLIREGDSDGWTYTLIFLTQIPLAAWLLQALSGAVTTLHVTGWSSALMATLVLMGASSIANRHIDQCVGLINIR